MDLLQVPVIALCECDKSSDIGEYLNFKNCKCRNKLVVHLLENVLKILVEMK